MTPRIIFYVLTLAACLAQCGEKHDGQVSIPSNNVKSSVQFDDKPSEPGHDIKVKIDGYDQTYLTLAYQYGEKQYLKDTATVSNDGSFQFQSDEALDEGVYLLVLAPKNQFLQFIVPKGDQHFQLSTSVDSLVMGMTVDGSQTNEGYFEYLKYLNSKIKIKTELNTAYTAADGNEKEQERIKKELQILDKEVKGYQASIADNFGQSLLGRMMAAEKMIETPEFDDDEKGLKKFYYQRAHYFDHFDLKDEGLLRTPVLAQKVKAYLKNYVVQHPDSIATALDQILAMAGDSENFKYFLIDQVNKYASSKVVGMDAVYVHLVKKYYEQGRAWWTDPDELENIVDNANTLEPILIGKPAPDLALKNEGTNSNFKISQVNSDYTVLLFWDPECSHCEKSMPDMIEFYNEYKSKGVEVVSLCTVIGNDEEAFQACADKTKDYKMPSWINATDQYHQSKFKIIYDIKSTPRIFILDKDKKIIMKSIGAEQISEVMKNIIEKDNEGV